MAEASQQAIDPPRIVVVDPSADSAPFPLATAVSMAAPQSRVECVAAEADPLAVAAGAALVVCRLAEGQPAAANFARTLKTVIPGIPLILVGDHGGLPAEMRLCRGADAAAVGDAVRLLLRLRHAEQVLADEVRRHETELADSVEAREFSESRFRMLFDHAPDPIFVQDADGCVVEANDAACLLHGLSRPEIIGRHVTELVPEELREEVRRNYPRLFTGEISALEGVSVARDGRKIPVEIRTCIAAHRGRPAVILHVRDISLRRTAEERLRVNEARYRAIVEDQTELICRATPDTQITFANAAAERMLGRAPAELSGRRFIEWVDDADRLQVMAVMAALTPARPVATSEHRMNLPDGSVRWHRWTIRGLFDPAGRLTETQSVGLDVTESRAAEVRQKTLLSGMRAIVEMADELIALPDSDSLYRRAVELARAKLGLARVGILLNRTPWVQGTFGTDYQGNTTDERAKRLPMDTYWQHRMRLRQPSEPRWDRIEETLVYWDGTRTVGDRQGWVAITPIQTASRSIGVFCNDSGPDGAPCDEAQQEVVAVFCSLLAHIAERKSAEMDRARLAQAVEQSAESVVITDTEGVIQYVNPGFERMSGWRREDALGKTPRIVKSGKHTEAFYRRMWSTLRRGQVWTGRTINRRRDGTLYEVEHTVSPVRDGSGQIINFLAVAQDVSATRELEAELRQAQKMEGIGRLAGGIAHDFNNLLTAILGFARMVYHDIPEHSQARADLDEIISAGERASRLTKQLLAFGRKEGINIQPLDVNAIILNFGNMLRRSLGEHVDLVNDLAPDLGAVEADAGQLEQCLMNLAINASDAMPRGGRLTIATAERTLDEEYCRKHLNLRPGPFIAIAVQDDGIGMADEVRERAFEPFFTTKGVGKGTGLGLATVYGIVKQFGGHVELVSQPGKGTTVTLLLPRAAVDGVAPVPVERPAPQVGTETILVAEDEPIVRRLTVRNLQSLGYRVLEARNGEEALEIFTNSADRIHLVLTDVIMPKLSGPDLVTRVRAIDPDQRFLFMSGFAEDMLDATTSIEGTALLTKPFTRETLSAAVRAAIEAPAQG